MKSGRQPTTHTYIFFFFFFFFSNFFFFFHDTYILFSCPFSDKEWITIRTKLYGTVSVQNKTVHYFHGTFHGALLHYYLLSFVVNSVFRILINDDYSVVGIVKSTYSE